MRIVGHDVVPADQLLANPRNWRIHPKNQQTAMEAVLDEIGWVREVLVNQRTGFVLDGHMRVSMAIAKDETVPVSYVDLSEEEEGLILAVLDPLGTLAVPDESMLNEVIDSISTENSAITSLLDGLHSEVNDQALKGDGGEEREKPMVIRALFLVADVDLVEQAIICTGAATRGAALTEICRYFINAQRPQDQAADVKKGQKKPAV